jgi:segregation and condensation protein A
MNDLIYKTDEFEGPLDLLLKLISKNKLSIYKIEISSLLSQYLDQINLMKDKKVDIASSFLEMAARLVYIKTVQLLPKREKEAEELKDELTAQLAEYAEYKKVSEILLNNINLNYFCRKPMKIDLDLTYKGIHSIAEIGRTYIDLIQNILSKSDEILNKKDDHLKEIVNIKMISVFSKVVKILKCLYKNGEFCFEDLFLQKNKKSELIAIFLAILELIKCNRVLVKENTNKIVICESSLLRWKQKKYQQ